MNHCYPRLRDMLMGAASRGSPIGRYWTAWGKGTKLMAVANRAGLPLAICTDSAPPHEVTLVLKTLAALFLNEWSTCLIGDKAYDSDPLDRQLVEQGIDIIAPHRHNRSRLRTQDGHKLRHYRLRRKNEQLLAWLQDYRRLVARYERYAENYHAFAQLRYIVILLRHSF